VPVSQPLCSVSPALAAAQKNSRELIKDSREYKLGSDLELRVNFWEKFTKIPTFFSLDQGDRHPYF
jgi:hypothetical protein